MTMNDTLEFMQGKLRGTVAAIPAKAEAHRALIAAALADGVTQISHINEHSSADIAATIQVLRGLGAQIESSDSAVLVTPGQNFSGSRIDCGESGSTLRFILPVIAAMTTTPVAVSGQGRLPERPLAELLAALRDNGAHIDGEKLPLTLYGGLHSGVFTLPGNVSSQYITGLLLALPLLAGNSVIKLTTTLESAEYVEITRQILSQFQIGSTPEADGWTVRGTQRYRSPGTITVGGDWSNAALWLAAGALGGAVTVRGLDLTSAQGDRAIVDILRRFGAAVSCDGDAVTVGGGDLHAIELDMRATPDLLPVLAVVAAGAHGTTRLVNAARLRLKESDRLSCVAALLHDLGGRVEELPDALIIHGNGTLRGGRTSAANDHRLVMAAGLAASISDEKVVVSGAHAVNKSYPALYADFLKLKGA